VDIAMIEGRFKREDIINRPACPFCGGLIERPKELDTPMPAEMPLGTCPCGAVYACDVTGHNLGAAMAEALVFACQGDWDCAWSLLPDEDYLEKQVPRYDYDTHRIIHGGVYQGRRISGTLLFIRLHRAEEGVEEKNSQNDSNEKPAGGAVATTPETKPVTKKDVEALVHAYDMDRLTSLAQDSKRIIRDLKRLLYSADSLLRWKAAEALGRVSAVIARKDPGTVSKLLQGLFTSITDTAASSWGAVDALGEIISRQPEKYSGYVSQLIALSRDRALLAEVLRALGKIGNAKPDLLRKISYHIIPLLQDADPEVRGYSVILLGNLNAGEAKENLAKLEQDPAVIEIYRSGRLERITVGQLACKSLTML